MNTVKNLCAKMISGARENKRRKELGHKVMKMKADDSNDACTRERKKLTNVWRETIRTLNHNGLKKQIESIAKHEMRYMTNVYKEEKRTKIEFIKSKHGQHSGGIKTNNKKNYR